MKPEDAAGEGLKLARGAIEGTIRVVASTLDAATFGAVKKVASFHQRTPPPGAAPGTIVHDEQALPSKIHLLAFGEDDVEDVDEPTIEQIREAAKSHTVTWVDVRGLGSVDRIQEVTKHFGLHRLAVEDVFNAPQRPKAEDFGTYFLLIARVPEETTSSSFDLLQVSVVFAESWVLTFQERYDPILDPVKERLNAGRGLLRREKGDYLAYAVLDVVIDRYFPTLEMLGEKLADLEDEALENPSKGTLRRTNRIRNSLLKLRRVLWPQQEAIHSLIRSENALVSETVRTYLRDAQDHVQQASDVVASYRDLVGGISQTWLSSVGNRTNDVMKVLTIMASIFIPLNFLAAVYGMNFAYMPELEYPNAYFVLLAVMATAGLGMVYFFYRRGWLSRSDDEDEE